MPRAERSRALLACLAFVVTVRAFQWQRIVPHPAKVRGWTITPGHYLNRRLDTVWLGE